MTNEQIAKFLSFLRECETQYNMAVDDEEEMNKITQDILHNIELEEYTYHEYAKVSKELKETRQKRRESKDTIRVMTPIVNWVENNSATIKSLERLLGDVRKAERSLENRVYVPRSSKYQKEGKNKNE